MEPVEEATGEAEAEPVRAAGLEVGVSEEEDMEVGGPMTTTEARQASGGPGTTEASETDGGERKERRRSRTEARVGG